MIFFGQMIDKERIQQLEKDLAICIRTVEKLSSPQNLTDEARAKAHASTSRKAREDQSVRHAWHYIKPLRAEGMSWARIATRLNEEGYRTRTGKLFHAQGVLNIYNRLNS